MILSSVGRTLALVLAILSTTTMAETPTPTPTIGRRIGLSPTGPLRGPGTTPARTSTPRPLTASEQLEALRRTLDAQRDNQDDEIARALRDRGGRGDSGGGGGGSGSGGRRDDDQPQTPPTPPVQTVQLPPLDRERDRTPPPRIEVPRTTFDRRGRGDGIDLGADVAPEPTDERARKDKSPIDDDNNLLVDLNFGLKAESKEKVRKLVETRLSALAFAINSINTSTSRLLTVDDLMKQLYPRGKFKEGDVPSAKIDLRKFLRLDQIANLRELLSKEPLNCATERNLGRGGRRDDEDDQPKAEPLRADVIVKAIMDQDNYYKLLGLSRGRRDFEIEQGIGREFDRDGLEKDQSENTLRLILPPGKSGVAHDNAQRLIVLQKGRDGLVIRTGDVSKNEATRANRNFIQHPGTARPSGSEEIWELPNGMRAYSARNGEGNLIGEVPHGLVKPTITNPRSCFSCHGGDEKGFIAMNSAPKKKVNVVDETVNGKVVGNKNLFRATWDDYDKAIAPANERYSKALEKSGASSRAVKAVLDQYAGDVSVAKLASEVDGDDEDVRNAVLSKRFRSAWDPSGEFDPKDKDAVSKLTLTRSSLESEVDLGAGKGDTRNKKPLYCAVKDFAREQHVKLTDRPKSDVMVRAKAPSGAPPTHDRRL